MMYAASRPHSNLMITMSVPQIFSTLFAAGMLALGSTGACIAAVGMQLKNNIHRVFTLGKATLPIQPSAAAAGVAAAF